MFEDDDFDRILCWQEVPDENSCSRFVAENYYISGYNNSNTYGYYNGGWEYRIVPLNTNLTQRGNDPKLSQVWADTVNVRIYVGTTVKGKDKEGDVYCGKVINFSYKEDDNNAVKYIWIFDERTMTQVALLPDTVKVVSVNMYMPGGSEKVKAALSVSDLYKKRGRLNEALDIFNDEDDYNELGFIYTDNQFKKIKEDDVPYRNAVIKMFEFDEPEDFYIKNKAKNADVIKLLDLKFYTDTFTTNRIPIKMWLIPKTSYLLGLNGYTTATTIKPYLRELCNDYTRIMGIKIGNPTFKVCDWDSCLVECVDNRPVVYSYKCIYIFAKCIMNMYMKNAGSGKLQPVRERIDDCIKYVYWNKDCKNIYYRHVLKYIILMCLFRSYNDVFKETIDKTDAYNMGIFPLSSLGSRPHYTTLINPFPIGRD